MSQAQDELVARASDPNAELATLHELAQNYPGLRPYVAANPRTYPALLDWLGTLGDGDVDAVLSSRAQGGTDAAMETARRVRSRDSQPTRALTGGLPPVDPEATQAMPAAALGGAAAAGAAPGAAATGRAQDQRPGDRTAQPVAAGAPVARSAPEDTLFGVGTPEREDERRSSTGLWILAAVALVAVVTLVVWFLSSNHGGSESSAPATVPGQVTTQDGPAASVPTAEASESPSETASPTPSATPSDTITAPAPNDAVQMSSFTAPSGNITCTLGQDSVSCTIQDHSFIPTDASCDNAADKPFTVSVGKDSSASGSCGDGYSTSGATLDYGASAKNGDYACTSSESGIECWSQVSGKGFALSRTQASTTTH